MNTITEIYTALKIIVHCDVTSMVFAYYSMQNFVSEKQNNEPLKKE